MGRKSTAKIRVRFADIDVMGHVNNAIYLNYFEQARMTFFEELIGGEWDWNKDGIVLARNEVDYKHPIFLNDEVEVETELIKVGQKSLTVCYEVHSIKDGVRKLCAIGSSVLVCFDYTKGVTISVPEKWKIDTN